MTLVELQKAQGLSDEQITKIAAAMKENKIYTAGEENLDIRYGKLKADFDSLTNQHSEATKLIDEMKKANKGNEELQTKIANYETQVANLQTELVQTKTDAAVKVALLEAKALDIDYMTFKLKEKGEISLDENGKIKGWDDKIAGLKTQFPNQFESSQAKKVDENKLPGNNEPTGITKEAFDKMGYADRLKVYNENPEVYAELTKK